MLEPPNRKQPTQEKLIAIIVDLGKWAKYVSISNGTYNRELIESSHSLGNPCVRRVGAESKGGHAT